MPDFLVTVRAEYIRTITADHADAAEEVAQDFDADDMNCIAWEIIDLQEELS